MHRLIHRGCVLALKRDLRGVWNSVLGNKVLLVLSLLCLLLLEERLLLLRQLLLLQMVLLQGILGESLLLLELLLLRLGKQTVRRAVGVMRSRPAAGAGGQGAHHTGTNSTEVWSTHRVAGIPCGVIDIIHAGNGGQAVRRVHAVPCVSLLLVRLLQVGVLQ